MRQTRPVPILLASLLVLTAAACSPPESDPGRIAPEELQGVWVSDNPDYAGRDLEILENALLFHTGDGNIEPYIIRNIEVEQSADGTAYEIEHSGRESGSLTLSLLLRSADGTIVFENQPLMVWRRNPSGS